MFTADKRFSIVSLSVSSVVSLVGVLACLSCFIATHRMMILVSLVFSIIMTGLLLLSVYLVYRQAPGGQTDIQQEGSLYSEVRVSVSYQEETNND
ncbi:Transmembrane domain-containing protein [Spironucleus salmonicida]|uniref:Transmembrane domain-containing protein n=1 Tax=Spironucleus salmonicida TaxID=348837 RepID=V6LNQ9_9EUKA|nr:Transmembrane domain-containing protein [Spironucleus salmonicida]|eukprot:EST45878.1 Transmembrane domain-containing protein [Spironucleus salmonicida]